MFSFFSSWLTITHNLSFFLFYEVAHAPSRITAEACLTGWPNAQPQWWNKCSVVTWHRQSSLAVCVCVKCRCCATSFFSRNELRQPACLQPAQSQPETDREACIMDKEGNVGGPIFMTRRNDWRRQGTESTFWERVDRHPDPNPN